MRSNTALHVYFDHHASMNYVDGSLNTIKKAVSLAGLKTVCCFEISDRPSNKPVSAHILENIDFMEANSKSDNVKGMLGLHANFTLSAKTLSYISDIIAGRDIRVPCACTLR